MLRLLDQLLVSLEHLAQDAVFVQFIGQVLLSVRVLRVLALAHQLLQSFRAQELLFQILALHEFNSQIYRNRLEPLRVQFLSRGVAPQQPQNAEQRLPHKLRADLPQIVLHPVQHCALDALQELHPALFVVGSHQQVHRVAQDLNEALVQKQRMLLFLSENFLHQLEPALSPENVEEVHQILRNQRKGGFVSQNCVVALGRAGEEVAVLQVVGAGAVADVVRERGLDLGQRGVDNDMLQESVLQWLLFPCWRVLPLLLLLANCFV